MNLLCYRDNLKVLRNREYLPDACVDLIYLGPPFNSDASYKGLFAEQDGGSVRTVPITAMLDVHDGRIVAVHLVTDQTEVSTVH